MIHLNRQDLPIIKKRLNAIHSETQPKWGRMGPAKMIRHLRYMVEMSLDEFEVPDRSNFLSRTLVKWLFFRVWTKWPKGRIKGPPELTPEPREAFEIERMKLIDKLDQFIAVLDKEPQKKTFHTFFGWIRLEEWSLIHGVHFSHHFRQFGV
jgi:hypothetical protein